MDSRWGFGKKTNSFATLTRVFFSQTSTRVHQILIPTHNHEVTPYSPHFTVQKKPTIHLWVTTMLATSKNVLFPSHNHLLTTGTDGRTLWLPPERQRGSSVLVVSRWLWPGNRTFWEVVSMVVTWWTVAFCSVLLLYPKQQGWHKAACLFVWCIP